MNFQFYLEKLYSSAIFKNFMKENQKAYLCSGFFTIDKEGKDNQIHVDFYIPETKKIVLNQSGYFRNPEHYISLEQKIITSFSNNSTPERPLRIWSVVC